jgi:hypothetical protein
MIIRRSLIGLIQLTVVLSGLGPLLVGSLSDAQGTASVSLAWNPPSNSSGIAGYRVYYGTSSGVYPNIIDVGNSTTATIPDLASGQTYFVVVTDYNTVGLQSAPSNQVVVTPGTRSSSGNGTPTLTNTVTNSVSILWQNTATGALGLWMMQGTSILATPWLGQFTTDWKIRGLGNFDGNGNNEILWYNAQVGLVAIWTMNGATKTGSYVLPGGSPDWDIVGVADFDHTGFSDILWRQKSTGDVYIWKCVAPVNFTPMFVASVDPAWQFSGVADVEGSGSPDLIWRNSNTGGLAIWQLVNDQPGQQVLMGNYSLDWAIAGFGDFNGAGKTDILWRNLPTGDIYVWLMNGFSVAGKWYAGTVDSFTSMKRMAQSLMTCLRNPLCGKFP